MNPGDLEGKTYGPVSWRVEPGPVADFVSITGDDSNRWSVSAPPGFAAAALFAVAPDLLDELFDRSVIHGEQTFHWHRNLPIGAMLEVTGTVSKARERGGVHFITFDVTVTDDTDPVLDGRSLFLVSGETAPGGEGSEGSGPAHSDDGDPGAGEVSASRADLIRYAAATRDWNPVHWDHEAGIAAGFPGVVVHGLLQAGWALRAAASATTSERPLSSARVRFRNPLQPAHPVRIGTEARDGGVEVTLSDENAVYLTATVEVADE